MRAMKDDDLDAKLDEHFNRFGAKLFEYVDQRFGEVNGRIDALASRVDSVEGAISSVAKHQEAGQQERLAMNHQLDRHECWHHQARHAARLPRTLNNSKVAARRGRSPSDGKHCLRINQRDKRDFAEWKSFDSAGNADGNAAYQ